MVPRWELPTGKAGTASGNDSFFVSALATAHYFLLQCTLVIGALDPEVPLATLQFGSHATVQPGERPVNKLTIQQRGREAGLIDHVVLTALLIQREMWDH